ncbi:NifB/NifX family molybdenum-iron cluster-binding protein [Rhodopseudomonas palustris]|uniref:Dinitrogenase iron-molybdenum cofactor biosynthesis domain-containing protein n=1 Tax=Rhodopseudomonas palustris (strain BisB18) TaxID=316056 RepID=Q217F4_RHOPB
MLIAVASQNFWTVTAHAGKSCRFLVFKVAPCRAPLEVERLDLPKQLSIHAFKGDGPHPLDAVDVVIAGSVGTGFASRMAARGVRAVATAEINPALAVARFMAGTLAPPTRPASVGKDRCECECLTDASLASDHLTTQPGFTRCPLPESKIDHD